MCGGVSQHVPYVKTMLGAVMALRGACSQAVHNKERCAALAECVRVAAPPRHALCAECGAPRRMRLGLCVGVYHDARACVRACVLSMCACSTIVFAASCLQWSASRCHMHATVRGGAADGSKGSA